MTCPVCHRHYEHCPLKDEHRPRDCEKRRAKLLSAPMPNFYPPIAGPGVDALVGVIDQIRDIQGDRR